MRAFEVRRFSPLRCANVIGLVSFCVYGVFALIFASLFAGVLALLPTLEPPAGSARSPFSHFPPSWLPLLIAIVYPVMGGVLGWIFGGLGALTYNVVTPFTGGIEVQLEDAAPPSLLP
jgi:hypothetical protein